MKNEVDFDLAVVGGGPAGTSAAITAARLGGCVLLLEAGTFPRQKVCGEFVSSESLHLLADLLRGDPQGELLLATAPVVERMRVLLGERILAASVSPAAASIPRYKLDTALWEAAQTAGVHALAGCEVQGCEGQGPFELATRSGKFVAKCLIVAAGRWSKFALKRNILPGPKWLGVKAHFREVRPSPSTDLYFFENGYCGVQPVDGGAVNACAMVRSDRATSLQEVFALHPALARRAEGWSALMPPVSTAPLIYREPQPVRDNVIFAGDAAAFIDPFVGDGISIALRSGAAAANCLNSFLTGGCSLTASAAAYREEYDCQFSPLLSAAARVRSLLSLPALAQLVAFQVLRLPGIMPFVIRRTRTAA